MYRTYVLTIKYHRPQPRTALNLNSSTPKRRHAQNTPEQLPPQPHSSGAGVQIGRGSPSRSHDSHPSTLLRGGPTLGPQLQWAALSSPSPLRGYHFGASTSSAAPKKVSASNLGRRGPKSYVPDGLTEDQYRQIKSEELAQQKKLNFGMWGPRFKQIDGDPDSNWFNLPSLWTSGFSADNKARRPGEKSVDTAGFASLAILYLRRYGPAYLMLLLSTQMVVRSLLARGKALSGKWLAVRTILPLLALKPTRILASSLGQKERMGWFSRGGTAKLAGLVAVLMSGLAYVLR